MGRRPGHAKVSRSAVVAALAVAVATVAVGGVAIAFAQSNLQDDELLAVARATSTAAIEPGQRDESIVDSFDRNIPDVFPAPSEIGLGRCGEGSVRAARADAAGMTCAIVRADLRPSGTAEVRFPIAATAGSLVEDRSLHFAGVRFGDVERSFPSLEDFWSYVQNRSNMLMYWNPASQVVLVEVREIQYMPTRGKPNIHRRGRVVRSFRGDWVEGELIEVVTGTEGRPEMFDSSDLIIPDPPELKIAFLNEHRAGPHYLDTGWLAPYGEMLSSALIIEDLARSSAEFRR